MHLKNNRKFCLIIMFFLVLSLPIGFSKTSTLKTTDNNNSFYEEEEVMNIARNALTDPSLSKSLSNYTDLDEWPISFDNCHSLTTADIDMDNELEIIALNNTEIAIFNGDGTTVVGWPRSLSNGRSLVVADIDLDSKPEIIVGKSDQVIVFNFDGTNKVGWPRDAYSGCYSVSVANIDSDEKLEIIAAYGNAGTGYILVWNDDGSIVQGWPKILNGDCTEIVIADIDKDGQMEIITASGDSMFPPPTLTIFDNNGIIINNWAIDDSDDICRDIAVADINSDGELEIITGIQKNISIWNLNGTLIQGWPITMDVYSDNIVIADINNDNQLEVVAYGSYLIYAWEYDGSTLDGWPVFFAGDVKEIAVGDVDNDNELEVIAGLWFEDITIINSNGEADLDYINSDNVCQDCTAVIIADINGDSLLEIIASNSEYIYAYRTNGVGYAPFPTEAVNNRRTRLIIDTDGDGLYDNEEEMLNTDVFNNDTDNDGYSDGEEIVYGTDPLDPSNYPSSDNIAPTINVPAIGAVAGQDVIIDVTVFDSSGVGTVLFYYRVNSGTWFQITTTLTASDIYCGILGSFLAGDYIDFYVWATDIYGNEGFSDIISFTILENTTIENQPPTVPVIFDLDTINFSSFYLQWYPSNDFDGVVKCYEIELSYEDSLFQNPFVYTETETSLYVSSLQQGTYYIRIRAVDYQELASEWSETAILTVDLDETTTEPTTPTENTETPSDIETETNNNDKENTLVIPYAQWFTILGLVSVTSIFTMIRKKREN